jgi:hypothetical protein
LRSLQSLRPRQRGRVYRIASARFGLLADELEVIAPPRLACVDERPAVLLANPAPIVGGASANVAFDSTEFADPGQEPCWRSTRPRAWRARRTCDGRLQQEGELRHGHTTLGTLTTDCRRGPPSTVDAPASRAAIPRSSPHAYGPSHAATRQAGAVLRSAKSIGISRA